MRTSPPSRRELVREAIAEVRGIYQALEQIPIQRDCQRLTECCQFRLTGRTPQLTKGEALVAATALRATGRRELPPSRDGACPLLAPEGKCLIYQDRPFGCRTHYCAAAGGPYPRRQVAHLVHQLEDIDTRLGGDGPRLLAAAIEAAGREM